MLKFYVIRRPIFWASFECRLRNAFGVRLQSSHVGVYSGITISVADSSETAVALRHHRDFKPDPRANRDATSRAPRRTPSPSTLAIDADATAISSPSPVSARVRRATSSPCRRLRYAPDPAFSGSDSFTYAAPMVAAAVLPRRSVSPSPRGPTVRRSLTTTWRAPPSKRRDHQRSGDGADADGDVLTISNFGQAAHGNVVAVSSGFRYTANAAFSGGDSLTYTTADGHGGSGAATVRVIATAAARKANYGHYFATRYADDRPTPPCSASRPA